MKLDFAGSVPIYQQIRDQIVQAVAEGIFTDGDKLPTIRALAGEIGVNTMTVNKAYQLLKQEGYIITDRRSGAVVRCAGNGKSQRIWNCWLRKRKLQAYPGRNFWNSAGRFTGGSLW